MGLSYNYGNASLLEIIWTFFALIGVGITYQLLMEARGDLAALRRSPTFQKGGARDIVAHINARNMWVRLVMLTLFVAAGGLAMTTPPANHSLMPTPAAVVTGGAFVAAELLTLASAILDRRDRAELFYQVRVRRVDELQAKVASTRDLIAPKEPEPEQGQ